MHQVLEVKELRLEIFDHLHICPVWQRRLFQLSEAGFRDDRAAILCLALACKEFFKELIPILWRSLEDIRYLFRLVPGYREPDDNSLGFFDNSMDNADVHRYVSYASMVQVLGWNFRCGIIPFDNDAWLAPPHVTLFQPLLDALPSGYPKYLLPQLKAIYGAKGRYRLPKDLCPETQLESLFVIDSFSWALDRYYPTDEWILMSLSDALSSPHNPCLNLTVLVFPPDLCRICSPELASAISSLIRHCHGLLHFTGPLRPVMESALLEARPHLLTLDILPDTSFRTSSRLYRLLNAMASSLKFLRIECPYSNENDNELQITSLPCLEELHIEPFTSFLVLLSLHLPRLTTLGFILDQYVNYIPETCREITPLLHRTNERDKTLASRILHLSVDIPVMPYVADVNLLLELFPNAKTLAIATGFQGPSWFAFTEPPFSPGNYPAHPNVTELRVHHEVEDLPARDMLDPGGELRVGLPRLAKLVVPASAVQTFRDAKEELGRTSEYDQLDVWASENSVREAILYNVDRFGS